MEEENVVDLNFEMISNLNPEYYEINPNLENTLDLKLEFEKIFKLSNEENKNE